MRRIIVLMINLIFILVGMVSMTEELRLVNAAPYLNVDVDTAYNMMTNGSYPDLVLLDVRTKSEYDGGHIYNAVWIPVAELGSRISELEGHENHEIIVYCKSGGRSVTASGILDSYNFTKVYNMLGGITAWQSSGYPVWIATVHNLNTTINYDTIQAAIDASETLDGHKIFVEEEVYYEHIFVNKTVTLIGENKSTTNIDGNGTGNVVTITHNQVSITGFTIKNSGSSYPERNGIYLNNVNQCNITNNVLTNNSRDINLYGSSNNSITENIGNINLEEYSKYNSIVGNTGNMNLEWGSDYNSIIGNNGGSIVIDRSSDISIVGNNCSYIGLGWTGSNSVIGNTVTTKSRTGIYLGRTFGDSIVGNTVTANNGTGIYLNWYAWSSKITGNIVTANNGTGIYLDLPSADYNSIVGNTVTANNGTGIHIHVCENNSIVENTITANNGIGIDLFVSYANSIVGNTVMANDGTGISLNQSDGNVIYHNNFVNNTGGAHVHESYNNTWDNGYPSGGNYWSDYVNVDLYRGPHQNETGSDGIWDHVYVIDTDNQDRYPLVSPWSASEWDVVLTVTLESYNDVCEFGVRGDATEEFDPAYDFLDPPEPPVGVVSYFWYPDNPTFPVDMRRLATSKIPPADCMVWSYKVKAKGMDGVMTISWSASDIANIPSEYSVHLDSVNMREVTEYSFTVESDVEYTFTVRVCIGCDFEYQFIAGWNMASFPCVPENATWDDLLGSCGFYQVYTWDGTGYIPPPTPGPVCDVGYWVLVLEPYTVTVTNGICCDLYERDLPAGWSMIGSICDCVVDANCVFPGYYQLMTWDGSGYVTSTTIEPGKSYWVLVLELTHILVDCSCTIP